MGKRQSWWLAALLCVAWGAQGWAASLSSGTYPLTAHTLKTPWMVEVGSVTVAPVAAGGAREISGYTWMGGRGGMVSGKLWAGGGTLRCVLTLDANGDNKTDDDAATPGKVVRSTAAGLRMMFPGLKTGRGNAVLYADLPVEGGSGALYVGVTQVLRAQIPLGSGKCALYVAAGSERADEGCLDVNGDGVVQDDETVPLNERYLVGVGDGLRTLKLTPATNPKSVVVTAPKKATGKLVLRATDAAGRATPVKSLTLYGQSGATFYLRPGSTVQAPEGDLSLSYRVSLGGGRDAQFNSSRPVKVQKARTVTVNLGGKVLIEPKITARNGEVIVETAPRTKLGQQLAGLRGEGETGGVLKVYAPNKTLALRASLEFG